MVKLPPIMILPSASKAAQLIGPFAPGLKPSPPSRVPLASSLAMRP